MSRSRRAAGAVRGPASALTSFLAGLGVEPSVQLTTWGDSSSLNPDQEHHHVEADGPEDMTGIEPAGAVTARTVVAGPTEPGEGDPDEDEDARPAKRRRAASVDSDDLDAESTPVTTTAGPSGTATPSSKPSAKKQPLKGVGEFMDCGECGKKFTVTVYTKEHPSQPMTWLCVDCCYALGVDPFAKPKKAAAKKGAAKKDDRSKVVHYETRKGALTLGDICIKIIGKYIEDVEQLGDIGGVNLDKVCRIISKSRRLTHETASLFYHKERTELIMYDCTNLVEESYIAMANLCPNLESLRLHLCGQLSTNSVVHWSKALKKLRHLELFAPFLVRKEGWLALIKGVGKRLETLMVTQSPRIDLETVEALAKHCPNLAELRLCEVGQMNADFIEPISKLKKLTLLDLSAPGTTLSDESIITLLDRIGKNLVSLNLSDNPELTDAVLPAIAACPNLKHLYLRHLVELTDEGLAEFFKTTKSKGFETLDLEKGHELRDGALEALIRHSGKSVEKLSLLGWREAPAASLSQVKDMKNLKELDLGWCREVTDWTLKDILDGCESIEKVKVWGCNQLSDAVPRKKGVQVIGIETHAI